jgi:hypothetical protein
MSIRRKNQNIDIVCIKLYRKPDGTLIPSHTTTGHHLHSGKSKPGLGNKSNVLFNFVQGVTSKRKSVISRDRELVKMLTEASVRGYPPGKKQ